MAAPKTVSVKIKTDDGRELLYQLDGQMQLAQGIAHLIDQVAVREGRVPLVGGGGVYLAPMMGGTMTAAASMIPWTEKISPPGPGATVPAGGGSAARWRTHSWGGFQQISVDGGVTWETPPAEKPKALAWALQPIDDPGVSSSRNVTKAELIARAVEVGWPDYGAGHATSRGRHKGPVPDDPEEADAADLVRFLANARSHITIPAVAATAKLRTGDDGDVAAPQRQRVRTKTCQHCGIRFSRRPGVFCSQDCEVAERRAARQMARAAQAAAAVIPLDPPKAKPKPKAEPVDPDALPIIGGAPNGAGPRAPAPRTKPTGRDAPRTRRTGKTGRRG
jgi:hypothetical protein